MLLFQTIPVVFQALVRVAVHKEDQRSGVFSLFVVLDRLSELIILLGAIDKIWQKPVCNSK
jgi:hypothetical protein